MSLSLLPPFSSPSHKSILPLKPLSAPTFPLNHSFLSLYSSPHGVITNTTTFSSSAFSFCRAPKRPTSASMKRGPSYRVLKVSSYSSFSDDSVSEFQTASDGEDDGADEEEEVVVVHGVEDEEDPEGALGPPFLPDRWDVLGLGQAMVI